MKNSKRPPASASFAGLRPASPDASRIAARASKKSGTGCELKLWRSVRRLGLKFKRNVSSMPGCPDLVFEHARVAVFVDGDFWHGRNLLSRLERLKRGHNGDYWARKIRSNVARDRRVRRQLRAQGWQVLRIWENEINSDLKRATARIVKALEARLKDQS
jgi:DNA mismatch endonuclease, patch repair protein